MKDIYYDVDITSSGTLEDYESGKNIEWQRNMHHDTKKEAMQDAKHWIGKVAGVRIVKVSGNKEEAPNPEDVFVKFRK